MKTLINPWKGLKLTILPPPKKQTFVKTLINPWKGLKRDSQAFFVFRGFVGENPNKSLEGIKTFNACSVLGGVIGGENPNKSLEGIKTEFVKSLGFPW